MKQVIVAIKDSKTGLFEHPQPWIHPVEAKRAWEVVTKNPETKYGKNPEDFAMYEIAMYDFETGQFTNHKVPVALT